MEHNYKADLLLMDRSSVIVGLRARRVYQGIIYPIDGSVRRFRLKDTRGSLLVYQEIPLNGKPERICPVCKCQPVKSKDGVVCPDCGRTGFQCVRDKIITRRIKKNLDRKK